MTLTLILLSCFLLITLGFSTYFAINFGIIILNIQDNIEESLDILDERYASIYKILETPLFYDSPEIRNVLRDIELSRDAILHIANILSTVNVDITTHDKLEDKIEK